MAWRISSYGTWCCALSFIVLLAGCDEGLDMIDAFFVQFAVRRGNPGGLDGPAMLGRSPNSNPGCIKKMYCIYSLLVRN
jgi:hypothetical protein